MEVVKLVTCYLYFESDFIVVKYKEQLEFEVDMGRLRDSFLHVPTSSKLLFEP